MGEQFVGFLKALLGPDFEFKPFEPHTYYHEELDFLEYIEEDCTTVTESFLPRSNIEILRKWDGKKFCGIVGIRIWGFSQIAPPEVVAAYKAYNAEHRKKWEGGK